MRTSSDNGGGHLGEVWRLSWNLLGTCLASSGDDGTVRIWKRNSTSNSGSGPNNNGNPSSTGGWFS